VNKLFLSLGAATLVAACSSAPVPNAATSAPSLTSGIETQYADDSVRAQDDFYRHVNGKWLDTTQIPSDKATWGSFAQLDEDAQAALRGIIENAQKNAARQPGSDEQKIGDLYASFMDENKLEDLDLKPLHDELAGIDAIRDKKEIPALIGHLVQIGVTVPYVPAVHQDNKDATRYIVGLFQSGLGLPDRDYYLKADDAKLRDTLKKYRAHVAKIMAMAGDRNASRDAPLIVALETALAKVQWTKVENRNPLKVYNKVEVAALPSLAPGYDWKAFLAASGIDGKVDYLIVAQPSYIKGFNQVLKATPLPVWKAYFKWHLLADYAPYLSKRYVDENFAFYGTVLRDVPENRPRWKRGVEVVEDSIGEDLGKLYVAKYFPPESKARMEALVGNLLAAYRQSIDTLDWMGLETRNAAKEKLARFTPKIGYPNKWRDYSTLTIAADDLVGNVMRAQVFEYKRNVNKLGKPIDRDEWGMTPQTVNAYYNPELNEIVFPAAILQPPFFNPKADDAVNYGGIGAVIGHEISHGFDDRGSQFDGDGNLRDWWSKEDHDKFAARTRALVAQYSAYEPVPGYHVNGELTLGENIADNSGLEIAYKAYRLSLQGQSAPVIDGLGGDQRFLEGYAQVWRGKVREAEAIRRIKVDPHSPPSVRGTAPLKNLAAFHDAFGVKEGDRMYLPPDQRISIW
jgi:predicted metalloendopeptidase